MIKTILISCLIALVAIAQPPAPTSTGLSCSVTGQCASNCYSSALSFYSETISGTSVTMQTNGIPKHNYMHSISKANPNKPCEQKVSWSFTEKTTKGSTFSDTGSGVIGVTRAGAFIFNHLATFDGSGLNDVANHVDGEALSLDACYGHSNDKCLYHIHAFNKVNDCSHDGTGADCELIGWMVDGRRFISQCQNSGKTRYLKSCYVLTGTGGESTSDYTFTSSTDCDLDEANGYDFTGKGIVDNNGAALTGYAYVATDAYPWTQPKFADTAVQCFTTGTFSTTGGCTPGSCTTASTSTSTSTSTASTSTTAGSTLTVSLGAIMTLLITLLI